MRPPYIRIARVVKPFGTSGFFCIEATGVSSLSPLVPHLEVCIVPPLNDVARWCKVQEVKHESETIAKIKLAGIETRSDVQGLLGHELLVKETDDFARLSRPFSLASKAQAMDLPYANSDVIGLVVIDEYRGEVGKIVGVSTNGAHALWEIESAERSFLFPAVDAYIKEIDPETGVARITLPEGLLDAETL